MLCCVAEDGRMCGLVWSVEALLVALIPLLFFCLAFLAMAMILAPDISLQKGMPSRAKPSDLANDDLNGLRKPPIHKPHSLLSKLNFIQPTELAAQAAPTTSEEFRLTPRTRTSPSHVQLPSVSLVPQGVGGSEMIKVADYSRPPKLSRNESRGGSRSSCSPEKLRGVSPKLVREYCPLVTTDEESSGHLFACLNSRERIPATRLNDDYCDCTDGTDEPGTSACPDSVFSCIAAAPGAAAADSREESASLLALSSVSVPVPVSSVPSSRVNDGICDCLDGSDEWATRACDTY